MPGIVCAIRGGPNKKRRELARTMFQTNPIPASGPTKKSTVSRHRVESHLNAERQQKQGLGGQIAANINVDHRYLFRLPG